MPYQRIFHIPRSQISALVALRDMNHETSESLHTALQALPLVAGKSKLITAVTPTVGVGVAGAMAGLLIALGVLRRKERSAEKVLDLVTRSIEALPEKEKWPKAELEKWTAARERILRLLSIACVINTGKAYALEVDFSHRLLDVRILTDARPVYDDRGNQIHAVAVCQTLRLEYDSPSGPLDLALAMDESDLRTLRSECDRALLKSSTLRTFLSTKEKIPVTAFGEDDDAY